MNSISLSGPVAQEVYCRLRRSHWGTYPLKFSRNYQRALLLSALRSSGGVFNRRLLNTLLLPSFFHSKSTPGHPYRGKQGYKYLWRKPANAPIELASDVELRDY